MYNIILDRLPTDYNGYLIRTDFRIGIQISLCLTDKSLSESDKMATALFLLYGQGMPDMKTAQEGLAWFMRCGAPLRDDLPKDKKPPSFFFDFDSGRIWASFKSTFGIDLHTANLHWFEFCYLMASVGKGTSLANAMEVREYPMKNLKGAEREKVVRAKMALTPPVEITEEQKAMDDEFIAQIQQTAKENLNGRS